MGAHHAGEMLQIDTYFNVPRGRLKLREIDQKHAELIWYTRADEPEVRPSDYTIVPVAAPDAMKSALAAALGVRSEVRKRRELWLWENVRIHLDEVDGLGTFIEFEAVISDEADEQPSRQRLERLRAATSIEFTDFLARSYGDPLER